MKERLLFKPLQFEIKNNFEIGKDNYEIDKVVTNNQNTIITLCIKCTVPVSLQQSANSHGEGKSGRN